MQARKYLVSGRVQGVGYRAFVMREARRRQLQGWVRNDRSGTVTCVAAGDLTLLSDFELALRKGPVFARVDQVLVSSAQDEVSTQDFEIRFA